MNLNRYQHDGMMHPFTCPTATSKKHPERTLVATPEGWICRFCSYRQDWAHDFMLTWDGHAVMEHWYDLYSGRRAPPNGSI